MPIQSIGLNLSGRNVSFGKKHKKEVSHSLETPHTQKIPTSKLYPAMLAMAGLMTLNGCSDDYNNFNEINNLKNEYFDINNIHSKEDAFALENIKIYNLSNAKDSIYSENKNFKYSAVRVKSIDHTTIFADGERKADGRKFTVISKYDKDGHLLNSIISDPDTEEKFFVKYNEDGKIDTLKNKNGEEIDDEEKRAFAVFIGILAAGCITLFSRSCMVKHSPSQKLDNK